jgi:quercetin dioxygenase-like cupin family protein
MTKEEAFRAAIERWHALPVAERQTHTHAEVFAAALAGELDFRTMGNSRKVIAAWLIRELDSEHESLDPLADDEEDTRPEEDGRT